MEQLVITAVKYMQQFWQRLWNWQTGMILTLMQAMNECDSGKDGNDM